MRRRGRRFSPRGSGGGGAPELEQLEAYLALNLFSWIRADYRTEAGGKVTAFQDKVADGIGARAIDANHAFAQASGPSQPALPVVNANMNGRETSAFGGGTISVRSTIAPANWAFMHKAAGAQVHFIWRPTSDASQVLFTDYTGSAGFDAIRNGTTVEPRALGVFTSGISTPGWTLNVAAYLRVVHASTNTPQRLVTRGSTVLISGAYPGTPSALDPATPLEIGRLSGASLIGEWADMLIGNTADPVLDASVRRYAQLRYGLT